MKKGAEYKFIESYVEIFNLAITLTQERKNNHLYYFLTKKKIVKASRRHFNTTHVRLNQFLHKEIKTGHVIKY